MEQGGGKGEKTKKKELRSAMYMSQFPTRNVNIYYKHTNKKFKYKIIISGSKLK